MYQFNYFSCPLLNYLIYSCVLQIVIENMTEDMVFRSASGPIETVSVGK
jgi:hypothetical protein